MPRRKSTLRTEKLKALGRDVHTLRVQLRDSEGKNYEDRKYEFGEERLKVHGSQVARFESGETFLNAEMLQVMHPLFREAGMSTVGVLFNWLEAQGLDQYVHDLKDWKAGK